jgi:predicted PurR-regulated permease PerM
VAINGLIVGTLSWAALTIIGVDYALPLAVLAAVGELIPYLGPVIASMPAIAVALTQSTSLAVTVAIAYLAIQQIEGQLLTPLIMRSQTHLSQALVIVALTMGYATGSVLGALSAIPMFAAGRVIVRHVIAPRLRYDDRNRRSRAAQPM